MRTSPLNYLGLLHDALLLHVCDELPLRLDARKEGLGLSLGLRIRHDDRDKLDGSDSTEKPKRTEMKHKREGWGRYVSPSLPCQPN